MRNMEEQIGYKGGWKGEGMRGWVGRKIKEYWTNEVKGNEKWNRCERKRGVWMSDHNS